MVTKTLAEITYLNGFWPPMGKVGFLCERHGAGLDWPEEKDNFSNNILLIFAAIKI